jgi:RNA-directed DNA polymerase
VEQVSAHADAPPRDEPRHRLVERLQQTRDRATRVRRHDRPTGDGTPRPLGIPAGADTLLPLAVACLLEASAAQDVRRGRDGYRPPVGALAAVDTLTITRPGGRDAWGVEADSNKCVETLEQDWMVRLGAERIADGARRRLMRKWLKAGVLDTDGTVLPPVTGTPPGGTVSPILAQVFRHDARDRWCETVGNPPCRGDACLLRDAAEFGCALADHADAERLDNGLGPRLEHFGLERSGAKTRIIPCSRHRQAGKTRVEVLGCACRWGKERTGRAHLTRRTARQHRWAALTRFTAWGKENRHRRRPALCQRLNATRRGEDHDDGVQGNAASRNACFNKALRLVRKWRKRRSQRHRYPWQGYTAVLARFTGARPRIVGRPTTRPAAL